jgi:hypothetical protein
MPLHLRRIRWKRIVLSALAATTALLALGAARTGRAAREHDRRFEGWLVAAPCDLPVDFSSPGAWQAPFSQTCAISHGESIRLWATGGAGAAIGDFTALDGLKGSLRIIDDKGEVIAESPLPGHPGSIAPPQGAIPLAGLVPFRKGEYQIQIEVTRGAPALAGAQQRLSAEYELCGLERLPAQISRRLSGGMWVTAALVGLTTCVVAIPRRATCATDRC